MILFWLIFRSFLVVDVIAFWSLSDIELFNSSKIPYSFYQYPYCRPEKIVTETKYLGEILKGDILESSAFQVNMLEDNICRIMCIQNLDAFNVINLQNAISDISHIHIEAVNTFSTSIYAQSEKLKHSWGTPMGIIDSENNYIFFNHWNFVFYYQPLGVIPEKYEIMAFQIQPASYQYTDRELDIDRNYSTVKLCNSKQPIILNNLLPLNISDQTTNTTKIAFTYSVKFVLWTSEIEKEWSASLERFQGPKNMHWFSIMNSIIIMLLLSTTVAVILLKTLLRDIAQYNNLQDLEDTQEETGWKLLHGDVFRKPNQSKLLAVCAGNGIQLLLTILLSLMLTTNNVIKKNQGAFLQTGLILYALMGSVSGYISARFNKLFDTEHNWKVIVVALMTAFLFPGVCFAVFFIINLILWKKNSLGAVSFIHILKLLVIWFGLSAPMVFLGTFFGYKKPVVSLPIKTNQIPRQIPRLPTTLNPILSNAASGILPFCAVLTELFFLMSSMWQHQQYYLHGFLFIVLIILIITSVETSITVTYFNLCAENYCWWWRSFWASAASSIYVFLFGIMYFFTKLHIKSLSATIVYFGYTFLMAYGFFLITGASGFITSFLFTRSIYGAIKID